MSFIPFLFASSQLGFKINGINQNESLGRVHIQKMGGDLNGDGIDDILVAAPETMVNGQVKGRGYIIFGSSSGFSDQFNLIGLNQSTGFSMNGLNTNDRFWYSVATGDVTGDGIGDIVSGTAFASPNGNVSGQVYVLFGRKNQNYPNPVDFGSLNGSNGFIINGNNLRYSLGDSVSCGDINGDNIDDILIGAIGDSVGGAGRGYLIFGKKPPFTAEFDEQSLDGTNGFIITGNKPLDQLGDQSSLCGDVNGDKLNDILITSRLVDSHNLTNSGASYIIFGSKTRYSSPFNVTLLNGLNGFTITGGAEYDISGSIASIGGDVNGDNFDDILIGAYTADVDGKVDCGKVYIIFGNTTFPAEINLNSLDGSNGFTINGFIVNGTIGKTATHAGDVNGDNFDDILFAGDPARTNSQLNLLFGRPTFQPQFNVSSCNGSSDCVIIQGVTVQAGDELGFGTSIGGDVNSDGVDDIIIGAGRENNNTGNCYVIFGRNTTIQDKFPSIVNLSALHSIQQQIDFQFPIFKDQEFSVQINETHFAALMGKPNDYSSNELPSWSKFFDSNLTLSGTPNQTGNFMLNIIARNGNGQVIGLVELNVVSKKIIYYQNFTVETEQDFFFQLKNNDTFIPEIGQPFQLNYTLSSSPLPSWLNFSETNLMFEGKSDQTGTFPITIVASNNNGTVTVHFVLNVVPKQREFQIVLGETQSFSYQVPDPSGGDFHYDAQQKSGATLPAFLTFDPTGLILSSSSTIEIRPQIVEVTVIGRDENNQEHIRYDYTLIFSQKETSSSGSDVPLGAIIGGTVGGVCFLVVVVVIVGVVVLIVKKKYEEMNSQTTTEAIQF
eukprot:TRINITY_DN1275_c0_g2_i2.p1 TRINITY_DN1275_c0_g2~~TRINITY_DN1275_c0_g2_i2.p1  ORF type:complete len:835 (-),score=201.06 TRINITY_DN1275_c0_g2_i2:271-2775(-)